MVKELRDKKEKLVEESRDLHRVRRREMEALSLKQQVDSLSKKIKYSIKDKENNVPSSPLLLSPYL